MNFRKLKYYHIAYIEMTDNARVVEGIEQLELAFRTCGV